MLGFDLFGLPGLVFGFLTGGAGFAVPVTGVAAKILGAFGKGWFRVILLLVGLMLLGGWIAAQLVHIANLKAERAELAGQVGVLTLERDQARANMRVISQTNDHNLVELAAIRAQNDRALAACGAEIGRLAQAKRRTRIITQRIDHVPDCKGIPDAYRAVFDELRQRDAEDRRDRQHAD